VSQFCWSGRQNNSVSKETGDWESHTKSIRDVSRADVTSCNVCLRPMLKPGPSLDSIRARHLRMDTRIFKATKISSSRKMYAKPLNKYFEPVLSRERVLGVLGIGSSWENASTEEDLEFLGQVCQSDYPCDGKRICLPRHRCSHSSIRVPSQEPFHIS
jgi:hypothetical protein